MPVYTGPIVRASPGLRCSPGGARIAAIIASTRSDRRQPGDRDRMHARLRTPAAASGRSAPAMSRAGRGRRVLWFVEADVVVHTMPRGCWSFVSLQRRRRGVRSYDDALRQKGSFAIQEFLPPIPPSRRGVPKRRAGCGAVRKDIFLASGGFDAVSYPYPSLEDIELGFRLRQRGLRIVLAPEMQGTHLKVWRLGNLLYTDIFRRALPWSRLIHSRSGLPDVLNVRFGERSIIVAVGILLAIRARRPRLWCHSGSVAVVAAVASTTGLVRRIPRARGTLFRSRV